MSDIGKQVPATNQGDSVDHLDDDKMNQNVDFRGATLQLDAQGQTPGEPTVAFQGPGAAIDSNRPATANSRKSTGSTGSRTTMSSTTITSPHTARTYFCQRNGVFENAVEMCKDVIKNNLDGEIRGAWLLTEIDHWDHNKEKIVILTEYSLLVIKFDFIAVKMLASKRLMLHMVQSVEIGDFIYPEKSVMPPRDHGGFRLNWNINSEVTFGQRWNPFASDMPMMTFAHHPLIYNEAEKETITYNVDDFCETIIQQIRKVYQEKSPGEQLKVTENSSIMIETYASLSSMVFNQSHLGYSRERGGVSF